MSVTVTLPDELADYVKAKLSEGAYKSSSEIVSDALRLMQRVETSAPDNLRYLRSAYKIGLDGGDPQDADFPALKAEGRRRLATLKG